MKKLFPKTLLAFAALILSACRSALLTYGDTDVPAEKKTVESVAYYLPKGKIEIVCAWSKDSNTFVFTVTPLIEAERGSPLWVKRNANPFFDDTMTLSVNGKGLLQTANVTTQDQTAATLATLISAAGSAMTFGAGIAPMQKGKAVPCLNRLPDVIPSVFHHVFDPGDASTTSGEYWVEIPGAPGNVRRALQFKVSAECIGTAASMATPTPSAKHPLQGVVVRLPIPYRVTIKQTASVTRPVPPKGEGGKEPTDAQWEEYNTSEKYCWKATGEAPSDAKDVVLVIPDNGHSYVLPLSRVPAVSRETDVALVDGTLQTLTMKRPSLVLGIASIPQTILTALVPIPLSIRQSAANNVQAIDTRLKAEADIRKLQSQ